MKLPARNGAHRAQRNHSRNGSGPRIAPEKRAVLITGGAGFVGTNVAHRYLSAGQPVLIFDNLARPGVEKNLTWLRQTHRELLQVVIGDIQDVKAVRSVARRAAKVLHLAAQVAVTTSLVDPISDFEINARGTLNLLEALRKLDSPPPLIFTSTNKVYGDLADVKLKLRNNRYEPEDSGLRERGFNEDRCVHFHSPYGCSKGAACQYVMDYARTFRMPTMVFRMSCIYGLHQFGNEDQGWVAHFLIRALDKLPITVYGDGRQVRDVLFVEDLVDAFLYAFDNVDSLAGQAFNIGGGPSNTISLLELVDLITELNGHRPHVKFDDWRAADQLYYVSDTTRFTNAAGWRQQTGVREGVTRLHRWLQETRQSSTSGRSFGRTSTIQAVA